jgi:hypothetical protein
MNFRRALCLSILLFAAGSRAAATAVPEPIKSRTGKIGGIESLVIDGKLHYFGFSYSDDLVLSPLIASPGAMAAFAARYMRQRDGVHGEDYWAELVKASATESNLASDIADRTIKIAQLRSIAEQLRLAEKQNKPLAGLTISYHLLYLLETSKENVLPLPSTAESATLGFDDEDSPMQIVLASVAFLNGSSKLPVGASYRDAATVARLALDSLASNGPANWSDIFGGLRAER